LNYISGTMGWSGRTSWAGEDACNWFCCWSDRLVTYDWSNLWRECSNTNQVYLREALVRLNALY